MAKVLRFPVTLEVGRDGRISDLRASVGDELDVLTVWRTVESVVGRNEVARIQVGEDPEVVRYSGVKGQRIEPALAAARSLREAGATAVPEIDLGLTKITAETATLSEVGPVGEAAARIGPELQLAVTWPEPIEWYGDGAGPAQIVDHPAEVARVAPKLARIAELGYLILWAPTWSGPTTEDRTSLPIPSPKATSGRASSTG